jgi:hypothetical protein
MADEFGKSPRPLPLSIAQNPRHGDLRIIVQNRQRHAAEKSKG